MGDDRKAIVRGVEVGADADGVPVRKEMPDDLQSAFRTRAQWLKSGFQPVAGAEEVCMHPWRGAEQVAYYVHFTDVEPLSRKGAPRNCLTCRRCSFDGICALTGSYVSERKSCERWELRAAGEDDAEQVARGEWVLERARASRSRSGGRRWSGRS